MDLPHLNLCLKAAQMGVWEATLSEDLHQSKDLKWDSAVARMHGAPAEQKTDSLKWFFGHIHPEDLNPLVEKIKSVFENQMTSEFITFDYRVLWPNGEIHHLEFHAVIEDLQKDNDTLKLYGVAKDITQEVLDRKMMEEQKSYLLTASRQAVLGEISGGITHELSNPLTIIQARIFQLQQMSEGPQMDLGKVRTITESLSKATDKIVKITKSLRAFARGPEDELLERVNLQELIEESLEFCKIRFVNHGIDVRLGEISKSLEIECHRMEIEEALLNLFNTAHNVISALDDKLILIEAFDKNAEIEIHITGSGASTSVPQPEKGKEMGLYVAKKAFEHHHGLLKWDSSGTGIKFTIRLPKAQTT